MRVAGGRADAILDGKASLLDGFVSTMKAGQLLTQTGILPLQAAGCRFAGGRSFGRRRQQRQTGRGRPHVGYAASSRVGRFVAAAGIALSFQFSGTHALPGGTAVMQAQAGKCGIAWSRSRTALNVEPGAPGNDKEIVTARLKRAQAKQRDAAFREELVGSE
jgi:hypothetical protein